MKEYIAEGVGTMLLVLLACGAQCLQARQSVF